jgi:hypothetical protein
MRAKIVGCFVGATLMLVTAYAQSPAPVVVQAASPIPTKVVPTPVAVTTDATAANLKVLRELKAANEAILSKQKAALETIDELQKTADQIKFYTSRT